MKLFDDIKGKIVDTMRPQNAKMRMCMMGARGVGKTSVLTSMFHNLNSVNAQTNLQLITLNSSGDGTVSATKALLNERFEQLKQMFDGSDGNFTEVQNAGIDASYEVHSFYFQFGEKGKRTRIDLEIKDFPGEYVHSMPDEVEQFIDESNAIIIAVDTPHLMECDGKYNEVKNSVDVITKFFKKCFSDLQDDKLILFVPLKCEKYFVDGDMDAVLEKLTEAYADLIKFFAESGRKDKIACAVTPILTVGEVVFDDFERDENGEVKTLKSGLPIKAKYKFAKQGAKYAPQFCEQPLSYLLSFILKLYERSKHDMNNKTFLQKIGEMLKLFPDDPGLLMECRKFSNKKIKSGNGYKVIQNEAKL